jgi:hypothetical protein
MKKDPKISKALKKFLETPILVDENMPDFSNAPFVLAKMEIAEKFISEHGLPGDFKNKQKAKSPKSKA